MDKYQIGRLGEEIALKFLISHKFRPILTNFRVRGGEIDLIVRKSRETVFFEVKTRTFNGFGWPEEAFTKTKQNRFKTAVFAYLAKHRVRNWRADLITVELDLATKKAKLRHFFDALDC